MNHLLRVLLRGVAARFYAEHAGGLTLAGLLAFGVLSNNEHRMLILAALASGRVLAVAYLLPWALYALVSIRFGLHVWARPENEVLRVLRVVPPARRWAVGLATQAAVLAPCWAYGGAMLGFAAQQRAWWGAGGFIAGYLLLLTALGWGAHEWALRGPRPLPAWLAAPRAGGWPPALWFLRARLRQPLALLALKGASVGVVWGICRVYTPATFDVRLLTLGALLTALLHGLLPGQLYAFERTRLAFLWNLPLTPGRRLGRHALLFGALLLPELVAWLRWYPAGWAERLLWAGRLWAFPVAALLLVWASLLVRPVRPDQLLGRVLPAEFGLYLLLLGRVPLDLLTAALALLAAGLTARYYWQADEAVA